jgi:probable F420-dependent oxidoreductase
MKVGVAIPQGTDLDGTTLEPFVRRVKELGFSSLWVGDHIVFPAELPRGDYPYVEGMHAGADLFDERSWTESIVTLASASGLAQGMELGFSILLPALRHPVVLAKQLATLDLFCGGNLIVGMGAGWLREEYAALSVPFDERIRRIEETLEIMRTLWSTEPTSHRGEIWNFEDMVLRPGPRQGKGLRCWYGGNSLKLLSRFAPAFQGWLPYEPTVDELAEGSRIASASRSRNGLEAQFTIAAVTRLPLIRPDDQTRANSTLQTYLSAGVEHLVVLASMGRSLAENLIRVERLAGLLQALPVR